MGNSDWLRNPCSTSNKIKIFSASSTTFGADANTQANEIDLGFPGTLPVANLQAFKHAIMFGLAINADIEKESVFERKNYFYPDLPKGYQTTQLEKPIVGKGYIEIPISGSDESKKYPFITLILKKMQENRCMKILEICQVLILIELELH